jgi:recombination protein RecA
VKDIKMHEKEAQQVIAEIKKEYGEESLMLLSSKPTFQGRVTSTGSFGLDLALGIGGLPAGRMVEIYGPESSGKSTLCQHIIAEAQKAGGRCAYIDVEGSLDVEYAQNLGVNTAELLISQPDDGEQALNIAHRLIKSRAFSVIVVDSVSGLVPKQELEGEIGDSRMGVQARLMSQGLRMINVDIKKTETLLIFVNQIRMKIGIMFGNPETTSGGEALKFYSSVRLDIRKKGTNKEGEESVSNTVKVRVLKNKVAPPFKSAEFDIVFGQGIDKKKEIVDTAIALGLIEKKGSWLIYEGNKIQGQVQFKELLIDNPEMATELEKRIKEKLCS